MSSKTLDRMNAKQMAKARKAAAKLEEAVAILRSLQKEANGYCLQGTLGHFAGEIEQVLSTDNAQAGLLPWLKSEGA